MNDWNPDSGELAAASARRIADAFADYNDRFRALTRETGRAFAGRELKAIQGLATDRIDLYDRHVDETVRALAASLGPDARDVGLWSRIKTEYQVCIGGLDDRELNKTYFNSLTRRFFGTVGVNPLIEFVNIHSSPIDGVGDVKPVLTITCGDDPVQLAQEVLAGLDRRLPLADHETQVRHLHASLESVGRGLGLKAVELMPEVFYRHTRAFSVGRLIGAMGPRPFMLAFCHDDAGVVLDAVITDPNVISMLFGFTRSYFHVDLDNVAEAVVYLRKLLPHKPVSELYAVLGRAKQGKTERYRELFRHLQQSRDQFIVAPGSRGMVMAVFTLPSYDLVFKVIRDRFAYPKTVRRREVLANYKLVFRHDRAGRLVDAQEFRRLRFPIGRFSQRVLDELLGEAAATVSLDGEHLVIDHLYVERRLVPLNLYLKQASDESADRAISDYAQAIHDLALSNIFPGDLLLKNFGVTRHGRVIFYDYDELMLMTQCRFRRMPPPRNDVEALSDEVWFEVEPSDIFPEQFVAFLGLDREGLARFRSRHGHLLDPDWWRGVREQLEDDQVIDWRPYPDPPEPGGVIG